MGTREDAGEGDDQPNEHTVVVDSHRQGGESSDGAELDEGFNTMMFKMKKRNENDQ